jgi:hypothetical protein
MRNRSLHHSGAGALLALGALLAVGLAAGWGCGGDPGGDLVRFVPLGATSVARLDGRRLRGTPLEKRLKGILERRDFFRWKYEDLAKKTGVDLLKDVDVVVAAMADAPEAGAPAQLGVIVRGRFDRDRVLGWLRDTIRADGGQPRETKHGRFVIVSDPKEEWSVAFVGSRTAVAATKGWIRPMLDLVAGQGSAATAHPEMGPLLGRAPAPRILSLVNHIPTERRRDMEGKSLSGLRGFAAGIDSVAGVQADLRLEAVADENARKIGDDLRGWLKGLGGNELVGKAGLSAVVNAIAVEVAGPAVHARLSLTEAQVDDAMGNVEKLLATQMRSALGGKGRGGLGGGGLGGGGLGGGGLGGGGLGGGGLGGGANPLGALLGPAPAPTPVKPPAPAPPAPKAAPAPPGPGAAPAPPAPPVK